MITNANFDFSKLLHFILLDFTRVGNCITDATKSKIEVNCTIEDLKQYWPDNKIPLAVRDCEAPRSEGKFNAYQFIHEIKHET